MGTQVRVVIVDDAEQTRESIKAMLETESWISVVGEAADGLEAVRVVGEVKPDLVLMDINMPGMDGIRATSEVLRLWRTSVVVVSVEGDKEYFRRAMQAGARDYLVKPFTTAELVNAVKNASVRPGSSVAEADGGRHAILTVFSTKGGVGKTTVATNLAVALARSSQSEVGVIDLDLEFGCQAVMFGIHSHASIVNLCQTTGDIRRESFDRAIVQVPNVPNLYLLPAPQSPEQAALVDGDSRKVPGRDYVGEVLDIARSRFSYVVVDTASSFREATMAVLDRSDRVLLVTTPDIPSLQNTAKCLDTLLEKLGFPREKVRLVLNRSGGSAAIPTEDVSRSLDFPIAFHIPSDGQTAVWAANCGQPFAARRSRTPIAACFTAMADAIIRRRDEPAADPARAPIPVVAPLVQGRRLVAGAREGSCR